MLIHGAIILNGVAFGILLSAPRDQRCHLENKQELQNRKSSPSVLSHWEKFFKSFCDCHFFQQRDFWLFAIIANLFVVYGSATFYQASVSRGVSKGLGKMHAALLMSSVGLFSCIWRIALCGLGNLDCTNRTLEVAMLCVIGGIVSCLSCLTANYYFGCCCLLWPLFW